MVPGAGLEPARLAAGDFESPESTNFTTRAAIGGSRLLHSAVAFQMAAAVLARLRPCATLQTLPSIVFGGSSHGGCWTIFLHSTRTLLWTL